MTDTSLAGAVPLLHEDGIAFRDRNRNGRLDPFEDRRRPIEERVADLLGQMTLEEKAGLHVPPVIGVGTDGELVEDAGPFASAPTSEFVVRPAPDTTSTSTGARAAAARRVAQPAAARSPSSTRLGIPVTDLLRPAPRLQRQPGDELAAGTSPQWPEPIGLAATRRPGAGRAVRRHRPPGVRGRRASASACTRMADLATEPRWARIAGTFGEDAELGVAARRRLHPRLPGRGASARTASPA